MCSDWIKKQTFVNYVEVYELWQVMCTTELKTEGKKKKEKKNSKEFK